MTPLPIYLEPWAAKRATDGKFRFVRLLRKALRDLDYDARIVAFDPLMQLGLDPEDTAPALYWRMRPATKGGRVFREAWRAPFWRIESSYERWTWQIAETGFDAATVDAHDAKLFCDRLRRRYGITPSDGSATVIALQSKLLQFRSFQSMAPVDMIRDVLKRTAGPVRIVTHPNDAPDPAELQVLARIAKDPRVSLHEGPTLPFLVDAGAFVTQNSTTTIEALLAGLPVTLYAKSDFHHVAAELGTTPDRDYLDAFVFWFLSTQVIRAGQEDVLDQIRARLTALGL